MTFHSYHFYAEFREDYDKSINGVLQFKSKIRNDKDYLEFKNAIAKEYDLKVDGYYIIITSLSYLGESEL